MRKTMIPKEFLGAFKAGHRPSARPFIDEELSVKLLDRYLRDGCQESKSHLEYITKFNNEFHKNVIKKGDESALHKTDDLRRDCYARENARNRDVFSKHRDVGIDLHSVLSFCDVKSNITQAEFDKSNAHHRKVEEGDW